MDWEKIAQERDNLYVRPYANTGREVMWINRLNLETCGTTFKTMEYQEEFLLQTHLGKNVVIYKSRQAGYTTIFLLHMIYILNNEFAMFGGKCQSNILYAAPNSQMCEWAKTRLKEIIAKTTLGNGRSLSQEIMRHITFAPFSRVEALCSKVFDYEFYDEFSFGEKFIEFLECAYPTMMRDDSRKDDVMAYNPPRGTMVFASSFNTDTQDKAKQELWNFINKAGLGKDDETTIMETHWYEVPYYNKNLVWKKYQVEPTIDKEGNVRYNKERWDKMIADGWIPTSPKYEKLSEICGQEKVEIELLN